MRWLSYKQAAGQDDRYIHLAREWGVSEVARGAKGFMGVYRRAKSANAMKATPYSDSLLWGRRRDNFVKRHLAQYRRNPTLRRALALRMRAYAVDDGGKLETAAAAKAATPKAKRLRMVRQVSGGSRVVVGTTIPPRWWGNDRRQSKGLRV